MLLAPTPSWTNQLQPVVASGAGDYGAALQFIAGTTQNVYFARLDSQLNPSGLGGQGHGGAALPSWATPVWNPLDREWALFWHEIGSAVPAPRYTQWMARLQPDGTFIERHPVAPQVTATYTGAVFGQGAGRGVIWNGDGFAMASGENGSTGLTLARLSRDGGVVSQDMTGSVPDVFPNTSLAYDGTHYGVVWLESGTPHRLRFQGADSSGQFVGQPVNLSTYAAPPLQMDRPRPMAGIVSTGDGWFVIWLEFENSGVTSQLWGVKLTPTGTEVAGTRRKLTCAAQSTMLPDLVWTGSYAAIAYTRGVAGAQPQRLGLILHRP
jgi:hypothetical protein